MVDNPRREVMAWKKPRITEIAVALEINGYACADD
jgi:coenzyme PQQ precursor peptide PqqA